MGYPSLSQGLRRWALLTPLAVLGLASQAQAWALQPNTASLTDQLTAQVSTQTPVQATKATAKGVVELLRALPKPAGSPRVLGAINSPNSYQQQALNFQVASEDSDALLAFYQEKLTEAGYTERKINTVSGAWGFSVVFLPPADFDLKPASGTLTLVVQATVLSPNTVNINMRYEVLNT
ncbi:MAG: hypothetical protein AAF685_15455 [Cyanobacteria bacterium P01_C01_bin.89]